MARKQYRCNRAAQKTNRNDATWTDTAFLVLCERYGVSAATTYYSLRTWHNRPAVFALAMCKRQAADLGTDYPGGFDCVPYRHFYDPLAP